jgi:hypothetical protein
MNAVEFSTLLGIIALAFTVIINFSAAPIRLTLLFVMVSGAAIAFLRQYNAKVASKEAVASAKLEAEVMKRCEEKYTYSGQQPYELIDKHFPNHPLEWRAKFCDQVKINTRHRPFKSNKYWEELKRQQENTE